ncbi:glycosyltransferase family 4 protein [Candidatus Moduliflexota bacterium]
MLFITERFPPSEGGSRVYYYNLCKNYTAGDVIVLTKKVEGGDEFDKTESLRIVRKGKPVSNWKFYQFPKFIFPLLWTIYLTAKEDVGVIHCGDFFPAGFIGLVMNKLFGKPYVYYVHGEGYTWFNQFRFQPKIRKVILRNAARIVAACSYAEEGVLRDLNGYKVPVSRITPGVEYHKFNPDKRDTILLNSLGLENRKVILTIGRLVDRKGQDTVIRAMPRVIAEIPEALYAIGGRGPHEEHLRNLAEELGVSTHVKFLGFIPEEQIPDLYGICDVFVMVNRDTKGQGPEGFGMVFTEASAAGRPVIGGKSGGTGDSILEGVTGYRVDPVDVDDVAAHIIKILKDDELRSSLGRQGREWVVETFDWRIKGSQLEELNSEVLQERIGLGGHDNKEA